MMIIDSQVHAYEANTAKRPWHNVPNWPDHVTGDEMVSAMDKLGIDGAIFISPFSMCARNNTAIRVLHLEQSISIPMTAPFPVKLNQIYSIIYLSRFVKHMPLLYFDVTG